VPGSRAARLAELQAEHSQAMNAYYDLFRSAQSEEAMQEIASTTPPPDGAPFEARARALLAEDPTDDTAYATLAWLFETGLTQEGREGGSAELIALIEEHHFDRPELGDLAARLGYSFDPSSRALLEKLVEKSPHREVRGRALAALAEAVHGDRELASMLKEQSDPAMRAQFEEFLGAERVSELLALDLAAAGRRIETIYERLGREYGDVRIAAGTPEETTLGEVAKQALFEIRELAIGKMAPEIEGEDVDGVAFQLSDYRGKVVMLDFWGFW